MTVSRAATYRPSLQVVAAMVPSCRDTASFQATAPQVPLLSIPVSQHIIRQPVRRRHHITHVSFFYLSRSKLS